MNKDMEVIASETALVVPERAESALSPQDIVEVTKERAVAVINIIEQAKAYAIIQGKRYLRVEAWQVIGEFDNSKTQTEWVRPVKDGDTILAWEARVNLVDKHTGVIRGGAEMSCGLDEYVCRGRTGYSQHVAAQSMAQTRAESKAFRMNYSAVALMAGFEATTAEEMMTDSAPSAPSQESSSTPFCSEHGVSYRLFEKNGRSWYSHRDGDNWCKYAKPRRGATKQPDIDVEVEDIPW